MIKKFVVTFSLSTLLMAPFSVIVAHQHNDTDLMGTTDHQLSESDRAAIKESINQLSPEQKAKLREQAKAQWDSMSPEQKRQIKNQMQEKWNSLTPEEQKAMKERARSR